MPERGDDLLQARRDKLQRLRDRGIDPFPPRYQRTHSVQEAIDLFTALEKAGGAEARSEQVSLAGRVTSVRGMGKASFLDIRDGTGRIQVHARRDVLGEAFELLKDLDLGDFIGVKGPLFRTRMGEVTVEAREMTFLAKALRPPPEKFHGLADVEKRYRQRYLDLMANPEVREPFMQRSRIIAAIRRFLDRRGFIEVETPILVPVAAGAMAHPFITHHNTLDMDLYLRIATELYLKRLIVGGFDRVYEIGRVFRNEGVDMDHNPEFTLLESYEAYADYNSVMRMVEEMVSSVAQEVLGKTSITVGENTIDLTPPWQRVSLREQVRKHGGIDIEEYPDAESLAKRMADAGIEFEARDSRGRLVDKLVSTYVEPKLVQPSFLVDYPVEMSPLAKPSRENPRYAERFEAFAGGMEIANSYTELNDPDVQREHMEAQEATRKANAREELDRLDEDFLLALEHGMPPTGGMGIGIDRLVMVLTGQRTIRDVVLFPQMRRQG